MTEATPHYSAAAEPAADAADPGALERLINVPPTLLQPSPTNPRKHFSPERVAEIAASMLQVGQIQPIRARPNPAHRSGDGRPPYEIVVGETRWRAATQAGLPALSVLLRDYTHMEVLEVQLVENLQRNDLHPMEEAQGYEALLRKPQGLQGYATVEDLAARVGKSASYVYQRLKLLQLCPAGREAFSAGQLSPSVALLIARMPSAEEQARATARIVAGWNGEPYSFRSAADYLQKEFMLKLGHARFDVGATYSVAGPCHGCQKRSGAEPQLFADVPGGADMCQDARCFQAKTEEAHQALLAAARDAGRTVLQGKAATAVLPSATGQPIGHYLLDAPCPSLTDSTRPLRALLGTGHTVPVVLVDLPGAAPIELVPIEPARAALKARRLLRDEPSASPGPSRPTKGNAAAQPAPEPAAPPPPPAAPPAPPLLARPEPGEGGEHDENDEGEDDAAWWGEGDKPAAVPLDERPLADLPPDLRRAEIAAKAGELVASGIAQALANAAELPLIGLRLAVSNAAHDLSREALDLLCTVRGWPLVCNADAARRQIERRVLDANGRELGELLTLLQVIEPLTAMPNSPQDVEWDVVDIAGELQIDLAHTWAQAEVCAAAARPSSAAGAARRGPTPDATEVFLAQHAPAAADTQPEQMDEKAPTDDHA